MSRRHGVTASTASTDHSKPRQARRLLSLVGGRTCVWWPWCPSCQNSLCRTIAGDWTRDRPSFFCSATLALPGRGQGLATTDTDWPGRTGTTGWADWPGRGHGTSWASITFVPGMCAACGLPLPGLASLPSRQVVPAVHTRSSQPRSCLRGCVPACLRARPCVRDTCVLG